MLNAAPEIADGMPRLGATTRERVAHVVAQNRGAIVAACQGAIDVTMERSFGQAWDGVNGGPHRVVDTGEDYAIVVTVQSRESLPVIPILYQGVPVHFLVR